MHSGIVAVQNILRELWEAELERDSMCYVVQVYLGGYYVTQDIESVDWHSEEPDSMVDGDSYIELLKKYSNKLINMLEIKREIEYFIELSKTFIDESDDDMVNYVVGHDALMHKVIKSIRRLHGVSVDVIEEDCSKVVCCRRGKGISSWQEIEDMILQPEYSDECLMCILGIIYDKVFE